VSLLPLDFSIDIFLPADDWFSHPAPEAQGSVPKAASCDRA
jgi:hypothetical protein